MLLEKVLHKLQYHIADLLNNLSNFTDETVQPSVEECNQLQHQLNEIQEYLAIYKYNKLNREISPSFNIHAKLSGIERPETQSSVSNEEIKKDNHITVTKIEVTPELKELVVESIKAEAKGPVKPLAVGINDKFRFINELFIHNSSEYIIAIEQVNNLQNWHECEIYLNSLKNLYDWKESSESVKQLYALVKKRFE